MSLQKNNKLIAILGGRLYKDNLTLRRFMIPPIRKELQGLGIDFILATNNPVAADQYEQIKGLKVVRTSQELHDKFMARQREIKPNLGAETRETINQYAKDNSYSYVCHLDDNITALFIRYTYKNKRIRHNQPKAFADIVKLLFYIAEHSNCGAIGIEMSYYPSKDNARISVGYPYSLFVHRIDQNFEFENSTEDDILMTIYNGKNNKPSAIIRNSFFYGKTGKKTAKDGNRKLYASMLKDNTRGEYISKIYPELYSRKVSYMVKSCTNQKEPMLQHKHKLVIPNKWKGLLTIDQTVLMEVKKTMQTIISREFNDEV